MGLADTTQPGAFWFVICQGAQFHLEFPPLTDAESGEPFDFTDDAEGAWTARAQVRDSEENLIVTFATSGEDGVITFGSDGVLSLDLGAEFTTELAPTQGYGGINQAGPLFCDIEVTDPADDSVWRWYSGSGHISREVTL